MEYTVETDEGVNVVHISGPVDVSQAIALRDVLGAQIDGPSARVLVDLSEVPLIDSSGRVRPASTSRALRLDRRISSRCAYRYPIAKARSPQWPRWLQWGAHGLCTSMSTGALSRWYF